jgi:hypothetical protein
VSAALAITSTDRRWWLALAASLFVHVMVISSPGWHVPTLDELLDTDKEVRIDAHLVAQPLSPAPQPVAAPPSRKLSPKPSVEPRILSRSAAPTAQVAAPAISPSIAPTTSPAGSGEAKSSPPAPVTKPPVGAALPKRVRIRFAVIRGEQNFVVGRSEHRLTIEGSSYTLRAVAETTGLVALFRSASVVQTSEGELTAEGMRPRGFKVERGGKVGDQVTFDWVAGRVAMSPGPRDSEAEPGMQDLLSMFYQLGMLPVSAGGIGITVATGKKIERFVFAPSGEEKINTALGEKVALRFKTVAAAGGDTTEVWIGVERRLPLRIRFVDRKGEIFDQVVEEMEVE